MSQSRVDRRIKKVECDRLSVVIEDELKDYYDSTNNIFEDALMDIGVSNNDPLTDDPLFENEITDNERELHSESDFDINEEESSDNYDFSSDEEFLDCEDEMEEDANDGDAPLYQGSVITKQQAITAIITFMIAYGLSYVGSTAICI